jgi:hypothetical protein
MLGGEEAVFEDTFQGQTALQEGWRWVREDAAAWAFSTEQVLQFILK